jgi:peptidase E
MAKLYFLGGEDLTKRDSKEINKRAFIDAGGAPIALVFIGWTSKSSDKSEKYRRIITEYFEELGASEIVFAELADSTEAIAAKMDRSDLVYLPGGDTRVLIERLKKTKVDALLRKYGKTIIGNSAGALALCRDCLIVKNSGSLETLILPGVGLVDFCVDVHYNSSKDKELEELSKKRKIYAIPETGALIYDEGDLSFAGKVCLFHRGRKTTC